MIFQGIWSQAIEYFLCDTGLKTYSLQRMYKFLRAFATYKFLKDNFFLNITPQEPKISPITTFPKL